MHLTSGESVYRPPRVSIVLHSFHNVPQSAVLFSEEKTIRLSFKKVKKRRRRRRKLLVKSSRSSPGVNDSTRPPSEWVSEWVSAWTSNPAPTSSPPQARDPRMSRETAAAARELSRGGWSQSHLQLMSRWFTLHQHTHTHRCKLNTHSVTDRNQRKWSNDKINVQM